MFMLNLHAYVFSTNLPKHVVYMSIVYVPLLNVKNAFLKMDAPFWGGVDISVNAHAYAYVQTSRSFFHVSLSGRCSVITRPLTMLYY